MRVEELKNQICSLFCGTINIRPVPAGYAISSAFEDNSGDRISFYLTSTGEGFRIEDDGSYLAQLIAKDIPIDQGTRGQLLEAILSEANAYWDRETYEVRTPSFPEAQIPRRIIDFLSSMIRIRDLELITREVIRSTFREDAVAALSLSFSRVASIEEDKPIADDFNDYPADVVIKPKLYLKGVPGAVYFVNSNDRLNEALLLQTEARAQSRDRAFAVIALIEEPDMRMISRKKFQRAQNRSLTMPIFRGDEHAAMEMIGRRLCLPVAPKLGNGHSSAPSI